MELEDIEREKFDGSLAKRQYFPPSINCSIKYVYIWPYLLTKFKSIATFKIYTFRLPRNFSIRCLWLQYDKVTIPSMCVNICKIPSVVFKVYFYGFVIMKHLIAL